MHATVFTRLGLAFACLGLMAVKVSAAENAESTVYPEVTNVAHLPNWAPLQNCRIHLEGAVWWANAAENRFVLQDDSGAALIEMDLRGQSVQAGTRVALDGNGAIAQSGDGFRIGVIGPVVDNDGVHAMVEKSGAIYLPAGLNPIRLDWYNGIADSGLEVSYEGPGVARQLIPNSILFTANEADAHHGLNFQCFDAPGLMTRDFSQTVLKGGVVSNFDLSVVPRKEHIGLRFSGFLLVPKEGSYIFHTKSDDGSVLFVGENNNLRLQTKGRADFPAPRAIAPGQILPESETCQWAEAAGTVTFVNPVSDGLELELSSGTGRMWAMIVDATNLAPEHLLNSHVRARGVCLGALTAEGQRIADRLLVPGAANLESVEEAHDEIAPAITNAASLPLLTTSAEVHRLKREEAERAYPVRIRGVVTSVQPEHQAFTIQDSTRGIYVDGTAVDRPFLPNVGELLEVTGNTDPSLFAPIVAARQLTDFGSGHLPEPVHPTWDQLLNGSLDAQYVEIQGIVSSVGTNGVTLLTPEGRIRLEIRLNGMPAEALARYEDALVRVRGCLFASWNYITHQVTGGESKIYGADISVDQPAPADLFATPKKTIPELLLFDPRASLFQRVKLSGQIVYVRDTEYYLTDGTRGLRFYAKRPADIAPGDLVEVVGFPELSGASPVLREAVARKIGHAPLPAAKDLPANNLVNADDDALLVRVKGLLASVSENRADQILEIQNGVRTFVARLKAGNGRLKSPATGSQLELTGVYSGQGGNKALGQDISSFELLLNSPDDIRVLARPPWWTLGRLLFIVGALLCVLVVTVVWITQLHRIVEERSAALEANIRERQHIEQQRAMEQERARVAQDLHDELGSSLTEISMLGARARAALVSTEKRNHYVEQMSEKAGEMVTNLDEIVWAMNPRHDSLASLVSYFCLYADRFLGLANIAWKLDGSTGPQDFVVDSRNRHQLFLAFKEALTNVVRHSGASEVRVSIQLVGEEVHLTIADNGRGLPNGVRTEEMDGVANMRARLEKLGGRFEITSEPGRGTTLRLYVPAAQHL